MSVRRKTENRMTIIRECAICGQHIVTTAETPWVRLVQVEENGKRRQFVKYYCSSSCFQASYKHIGWYDGKTEERKRERDKNRDPAKRAEQWKRYYSANGDTIRAKRMDRYWTNHEEELESMRFYRRKKKLLEADA